MTLESHPHKNKKIVVITNNKIDFVGLCVAILHLVALIHRDKVLWINRRIICQDIEWPFFFGLSRFQAKKSALAEKVGRPRYQAQERTT
jgi:hypothetical protein